MFIQFNTKRVMYVYNTNKWRIKILINILCKNWLSIVSVPEIYVKILDVDDIIDKFPDLCTCNLCLELSSSPINMGVRTPFKARSTQYIQHYVIKFVSDHQPIKFWKVLKMKICITRKTHTCLHKTWYIIY